MENDFATLVADEEIAFFNSFKEETLNEDILIEYLSNEELSDEMISID